MSEDRLNEIKRRPLFEDVPWLISEVERRRLDAVRAQEHMEEYSRDKVQLEAEVERLQVEAVQRENVVDEMKEFIVTLRKVLEQVRVYLEERGIRERGFVGRSIILPTIDKVLDQAQEEDEPLFEGKWTGSMGPTQEDK